MNSVEVIHPSSFIPHPSRLLVIRLSALGDVIHTIPAVVALRDRFEIGWAVEEAYRELVEVVSGVKAVPVSLKKWSLTKMAAARRAVRTYDLAIDFQGLVKSALLARASGARERIGFASEFIREKPASWFMNRHVRIDPARHVVEWNTQLAGVEEVPKVDFRSFTPDEPKPTSEIVLLPAAGRREKQWPVERWREVARHFGDRALAAWGPGEEELARATGARVAPPTTLRELARLLRDAVLVVGGDTGPLHLAAALGTRVVGLYGPTSPARNGPYGQLQNVVEAFSTTKEMESIEVPAVLRKAEEVLA